MKGWLRAQHTEDEMTHIWVSGHRGESGLGSFGQFDGGLIPSDLGLERASEFG